MLECLKAFEQWFTANGGWLHPALELAYQEDLGVHVRVKHGASLAADTRVCSCPVSLSFSCLNAVASSLQPNHDLPWPTMAASLPPEPVGWFFLVHEYLASNFSFWKPYIDTLPAPGVAERLGTLVYFDAGDLEWLGGTNLLAAHWERTRAWQTYWRDGLEILKKFDWPVERYTWELFQWAATVYTSRSFTSQWLTSDATEYSSVDPSRATENGNHDIDKVVDQRTYRAYSRTTGDNPIAVTVSLPFAHGPFQVLFPILDAFNHDHSAEVNWSFDRDAFSMTVEEPKKQGEEVFNNYGRKANEELLMGYGFCTHQNPWDRFALAFKPPPAPVQNRLRTTHPELFDLNGWNSSAGTFYLPGPRYIAQGYDHRIFSFWNTLPPTLIELLFHMVMRERGKDVALVNLEQYLSSNKACPDIFAISRHFLEQVQPMLARIMHLRSCLPLKPKNRLQTNAQMYRDGQIRILENVVRELRKFIQSIQPATDLSSNTLKSDTCSALLTLPEVLAVWNQAFPSAHQTFLSGIEQTANTSDVHLLLQAGWEEDIWALWLCWLLIMDKNGDFEITKRDGVYGDNYGNNNDNETGAKLRIGGWIDWLRGSYLPGILERVRNGTLLSTDPRTRFEALRDVDLGGDRDVAETALSDLEDHLKDLMGIVLTAATSAPDTLWANAMWSGDLIALWGLRITKYECVEKCLLHDGHSNSDADEGLVMYLHRPDGKHCWLEPGYEP